MNDDIRLERLYGDGLHSMAPARAPDRLRSSIKSETSHASPRPRWLALIKEPPMRTNSRLAVGSPTWRVAATMAATMLVVALVVGASFAGAQLFAKDGFIVDASGGGTHETITAAVADAEEGYEIFVRPGTYEEAFELDKTLTIRGDGPVEDIVVTAPDSGPTVPLTGSSFADPYAIHVSGGDAIVSGLTFRGQPSEIIVTGGSPTLEGLVLEEVGLVFDGSRTSPDGSSILVMGPEASATIRDNELHRGGPIALLDGSMASIEGNRLSGGPHIYLPGQHPGTFVTNNEVAGTSSYGLNVHDTTGVEITDNTFSDTVRSAIRVRDGGNGLVARNSVVNVTGGAGVGVTVSGADGLLLSENEVQGTTIGISWSAGTGTIENNVLTQNVSGLVIGGGSPVVLGNESCDNERSNFVVRSVADPDVQENDFCPEPEAESTE